MAPATPRRLRWLAWTIGVVVLALLAWAIHAGRDSRADARRGAARPATSTQAGRTPPPLLPAAVTTETVHYRIHSTATPAQTAQVAQAVESLHAGYAALFPSTPTRREKLALVLYRDRAQFKRNNHSRPWAEAYYLPPRSYAYFDANARNPYHWMLHEATHQLMREVSGFPRRKWIDEGVAAYLGASRLVDGTLRAGDPDPDAYPTWWLREYAPSGNLAQDIASGRIIPLQQLVSGRGGPDENRYFNLYYVHYWSLSHFLFHYRGGEYAPGYRRLIAEGGSVDAFERLIGALPQIQREWYAYFQEQVAHADNAAAAR